MNAFEQKMQEVADSIRSKTGGTQPIEVNNYPTEIDSISGGLPSRVYKIQAEANPVNGGEIVGTGVASENMTITIEAKPDTENYYYFKTWKDGENIVSENPVYTFKVNDNKTLISTFERILPKFIINVSVEPIEGGNVAGFGEYELGKEITLTAVSNNSYSFKGWIEQGTNVSTSESYTFIVDKNRDLIAFFEALSLYIPGVDWWRSTNFTVKNCKDIAFGNGKFIVIGGDINNVNKLCITEDGKNWIFKSIPGTSSSIWSAITYVNNRFIMAQLHSGNIAVSEDDGENWTITKKINNSSQYWKEFCVNDNIVILISLGMWDSNDNFTTTKVFAYSEDYGETFTVLNFPTSINAERICYGNNRYLVSLSGSNNYLYSTNGKNWVLKSAPDNLSGYRGLAFSPINNRFVLTSLKNIFYSDNGTNWTKVNLSDLSLGTTYQIQSLIYGGNKFIIPLSKNKNVLYSETGEKWLKKENLIDSQTYKVLGYGGEKYIVISENGVCHYSNKTGEIT